MKSTRIINIILRARKLSKIRNSNRKSRCCVVDTFLCWNNYRIGFWAYSWRFSMILWSRVTIVTIAYTAWWDSRIIWHANRFGIIIGRFVLFVHFHHLGPYFYDTFRINDFGDALATTGKQNQYYSSVQNRFSFAITITVAYCKPTELSWVSQFFNYLPTKVH